MIECAKHFGHYQQILEPRQLDATPANAIALGDASARGDNFQFTFALGRRPSTPLLKTSGLSQEMVSLKETWVADCSYRPRQGHPAVYFTYRYGTNPFVTTHAALCGLAGPRSTPASSYQPPAVVRLLDVPAGDIAIVLNLRNGKEISKGSAKPLRFGASSQRTITQA